MTIGDLITGAGTADLVGTTGVGIMVLAGEAIQDGDGTIGDGTIGDGITGDGTPVSAGADIMLGDGTTGDGMAALDGTIGMAITGSTTTTMVEYTPLMLAEGVLTVLEL